MICKYQACKLDKINNKRSHFKNAKETTVTEQYLEIFITPNHESNSKAKVNN